MTDSISLHKPQVSVNEKFLVHEELRDEELTFEVWEKLKTARVVQDSIFIVIGKLLKLVRDRRLYRYLDFDNFNQFLSSEELSFSREKAYVYIRIYELYVEKLQLAEKDIQSLGVARLMRMAPIIKEIKDRQEAIAKIESFKDIRYGDFIREIEKEKNPDGKPEVYWSDEKGMWHIDYYEDRTSLRSLGVYEKEQ
jgi:hypothetical protein